MWSSEIMISFGAQPILPEDVSCRLTQPTAAKAIAHSKKRGTAPDLLTHVTWRSATLPLPKRAQPENETTPDGSLSWEELGNPADKTDKLGFEGRIEIR